ncbi:hypothetical protein SNE40_011879 [Patella caerulea]|uniref:N-acetyltransferase ESCO2 n=1 Tax=Patella caerulea TaxID=87958 RepID=A0AAN8PMB4_PATCE
MDDNSSCNLSKKRRWLSSPDEGKKRLNGELSPRKRRRMKSVESPNSSPLKSPFVSDSDDAPTFRTKSFYRSKGNSKFAAITSSTKENQPSPLKKLTPRRISSRIQSLTLSESESDHTVSVKTAPIKKDNFRSNRLKSMTSSDSESEPNFVKVLRSRSNKITECSTEYDFPSVIPIIKDLTISEKRKAYSESKINPRISRKTITHTPPLKKNSGKKFFSAKCPSNPKSVGSASVIVRKGFDLKFVPRRISDQFSNTKSKNKTPKLLNKSKTLKQKEARAFVRKLSSKIIDECHSATAISNKNLDQTEICMNSNPSPKSISCISSDLKTTVTSEETTEMVSQDSAVVIGISNESYADSVGYLPLLKSPTEPEQPFSGSQDLFSDAVSDISMASSYASGPCERKLRSGITYSPSQKQNQSDGLTSPSRKKLQLDILDSPSRRSLRLDAMMNSPSAQGLRSDSLESPLKKRKVLTPLNKLLNSPCKSNIISESILNSPDKRVLRSESPLRKKLAENCPSASPVKQIVCNVSSPSLSLPVKSMSSDKPLFSIFGTPDQRRSLKNMVPKSPSVKSISPGSTPKLSPKLKKLIKDKDGKNVEQLILDAGQKKFGATVCDVCGMVYTHADPVDETTHAKFHISLINTLKFTGWKKERIVQEYPLDGSRIIMVLSDDPKYSTKKVADINKIMGQELGFPEQAMSFHSNYKAFLYISEEKTIEGCCIAESINEGFRVIPEQISSAPIPNECHQQRPWYCETKAEKADIGISRIWVYKLARQKGIGSRLLDSVRSCFHYGGVIDRKQIAFSDPTPDGKKFATKYTGSPAFLVYKYTR